jgi:hypothetical protein
MNICVVMHVLAIFFRIIGIIIYNEDLRIECEIRSNEAIIKSLTSIITVLNLVSLFICVMVR